MKRLKYLLVVLTVVSMLFITVSAKTISTNYTITGATKSGNILTIEDGATSITIEAEIDSGYLGELENVGGELTVKVPLEIEGGNVSYQISVNGERASDLSKTIKVEASDVANGIKVIVWVLNVDKDSITSAKLSNLSITCVGNETPTPSATDTPKPTATATPTSAPSSTPDTTASSTSSGTIYEKTFDPYDNSKRVTNAPPTISGELEIDESDIATQAPDESATTTETVSSKLNSDPTFGLILLFVVLILLLGADIAVIIWRKKLGFWQLINGGVARRKINDNLCDNPEDFISEDAVEQDYINDTPREITETKIDNSFDNDLSK